MCNANVNSQWLNSIQLTFESWFHYEFIYSSTLFWEKVILSILTLWALVFNQRNCLMPSIPVFIRNMAKCNTKICVWFMKILRTWYVSSLFNRTHVFEGYSWWFWHTIRSDEYHNRMQSSITRNYWHLLTIIPSSDIHC